MSINLPHNNLMSLADYSFKKFSSNILVTNVGETGITYQQAQEKVIQLQSMLKELGVKQGDKIAICSQNMPHWGIAATCSIVSYLAYYFIKNIVNAKPPE